jgi:hypothetical protein
LRGETPNLVDYLPKEGAERRSLLIELVRVDRRFRRKMGRPAQIEQYREKFPELAADKVSGHVGKIREDKTAMPDLGC